MEKPLHVFCCYARTDQSYLLELNKRLIPLQRQGLIVVHADVNISPGEDWEQKIHHYLGTAHVILLLVSSDFIASEYCYSSEMMRALERHNAGDARVIPIILRPVDLRHVPFGKIQSLPTDAKPVTRWSDQDDAFLDVTNGIEKIIEKLLFPVQYESFSPEKMSLNQQNQPASIPPIEQTSQIFMSPASAVTLRQLADSHAFGVQEPFQPSSPHPTKWEKAGTILSYLMPMIILVPSTIPPFLYLIAYLIAYLITFWFGRKSQIIRFHLIQSFIFALFVIIGSFCILLWIVISTHININGTNIGSNVIAILFVIFYALPAAFLCILILFDSYTPIPLISFFSKKIAKTSNTRNYYK